MSRINITFYGYAPAVAPSIWKPSIYDDLRHYEDEDEDEWCECERCGKEIRKDDAWYGYGEHSDEPYCKACVDWYEQECTDEENIFFS